MEAEEFVFLDAGGLAAGAGEEPVEEALAEGDLHAQAGYGPEEPEDEGDGNHVADDGEEVDASGAEPIFAAEAGFRHGILREDVADGDGPAEFDDGQQGDEGDGQVLGEAFFAEAFGNLLAGGFVSGGGRDGVFGGGALKDNWECGIVCRWRGNGDVGADGQRRCGEEDGEGDGGNAVHWIFSHCLRIFLKRRSMRKKRMVSARGWILLRSAP